MIVMPECFLRLKFFCQVMNQCIENYECLVINNNAKSNKIEDQVFWYKAESHPPFQMGAAVFWEHHTNNYNEQYEQEEQTEVKIKNVRVRWLMLKRILNTKINYYLKFLLLQIINAHLYKDHYQIAQYTG